MKKILLGIGAVTVALILGVLINIGSCYLTASLGNLADSIGGFWAYILYAAIGLPFLSALAVPITSLPMYLSKQSGRLADKVVAVVYALELASCIYMQLGMQPRMLIPMILVIISMVILYGVAIYAITNN